MQQWVTVRKAALFQKGCKQLYIASRSPFNAALHTGCTPVASRSFDALERLSYSRSRSISTRRFHFSATA